MVADRQRASVSAEQEDRQMHALAPLEGDSLQTSLVDIRATTNTITAYFLACKYNIFIVIDYSFIAIYTVISQ